MSTNYRIRKPYILATLPRPFDPENGKFNVGEVWGYSLETPRKKRAEVIAAIDGESVNLYDITTSSLITSHPVSPEHSFTTAPVSLRLRLPAPSGTTRLTYAATVTGTTKPKQHLTCFIDSISTDGKATTTTHTTAIPTSSRITHLDASTVVGGIDEENKQGRFSGNLIATTEDGSVFCFHPDAPLPLLWSLPSLSLAQDEISPYKSLTVHTASLVPAGDAINGLFAGDSTTVESAFSQSLSASAKARSDTLILVVTGHRPSGSERLLVALAVNPTSTSNSTTPALVRLLVARLPEPPKISLDASRSYKLHVPSGSLTLLAGENLYVYTISSALPRLAATMARPSTTSLLRLTNYSILTSTPSSTAIVNPIFNSIQTSLPIDLSQIKEGRPEGSLSIDLISYFRKVNLVIGLVADRLISIPVEPPRSPLKKRTVEGLLIDSIGRGEPRPLLQKRHKSATIDTFFASPLPGTATEEYLSTLLPEMTSADNLLASSNIGAFDALIAPHFGLKVGKEGEWIVKQVTGYPLADRRWILYTISRAISIDEQELPIEETPTTNDRLPEVKIVLPTSSVLPYLAESGHLNLQNLRAAFRTVLETSPIDIPDSHLAKSLVSIIVSLDPSLSLLASWLSATNLTVLELLAAILALMHSLGFLSSSEAEIPEETDSDTDKEAAVQLQMALLEREVAATESYLGAADEDPRAQALNTAFASLAATSSSETVAALRAIVSPAEVFSLIRVLRNELLRASWTTRYLDQPQIDDVEVANDSLMPIADLLSRCIDAIGLLGWILQDSLSPTLTTVLPALSLEVSAVLEGLEECVVLQGLVSGVVSHASVLQRRAALRASREGRVEKEVSVGLESMLPLGSRVDEGVWKVGKGGEVVMRSHREMEHMLSKGTRVYSLEKLLF